MSEHLRSADVFQNKSWFINFFIVFSVFSPFLFIIKKGLKKEKSKSWFKDKSVCPLSSGWWVRGGGGYFKTFGPPGLHHGSRSLQSPVTAGGFPPGQSAVWRPDRRSARHLSVHRGRLAGVWLPGIPEHRFWVQLHHVRWVQEENRTTDWDDSITSSSSTFLSKKQKPPSPQGSV